MTGFFRSGVGGRPVSGLIPPFWADENEEGTGESSQFSVPTKVRLEEARKGHLPAKSSAFVRLFLFAMMGCPSSPISSRSSSSPLPTGSSSTLRFRRLEAASFSPSISFLNESVSSVGMSYFAASAGLTIQGEVADVASRSRQSRRNRLRIDLEKASRSRLLRTKRVCQSTLGDEGSAR